MKPTHTWEDLWREAPSPQTAIILHVRWLMYFKRNKRKRRLRAYLKRIRKAK